MTLPTTVTPDPHAAPVDRTARAYTSAANAFAVAAAAGAVADAWTTHRVLALGGVELNPSMASLITSLGAGPALALRAVVGVTLALVLWFVCRRAITNRDSDVWVLAGIAAFGLLAFVAFDVAALVGTNLGNAAALSV